VRKSQGLSGARVLVVAPQPFYEDRGTPIATCQLLQALSQLAYEVDVLTYPIGRSIEIPHVRYFRSLNPLRLRQVPVGFSARKLLLDATLVAELVHRLSTRAYFCIHALEEAAFPAVVLGRRFGVPVIYDMQSSLPEQLARLLAFSGAPMQWALRGLERWVLRQAASVVSNSGLAPRVRALAPTARLREWEYSGTLPAASPEEAAALRRDLGIPLGRPVVLYSGTFAPYQGLPRLFAAIPYVRAAVPDVVFVVVGAPEAGGAAVEREHVELVRDGALKVIERQPRERIPAFLALADVVVSPRAYGDNLPLKIFDYLAAGKPIVATDIPAHRAALDKERALLTGPEALDFALGIVRLLREPALAARLAASGRAYAEEKLDWFSFVRSVGDLYEGINPEGIDPGELNGGR
jgi:glycosyltransferase involved in cell wall biosynthesis